MKTCPVCKARCFDDMEICYGCLHRFRNAAAEGSPQQETEVKKPEDPFQEGDVPIAEQHLPQSASALRAAPAVRVPARVDAEVIVPEQEDVEGQRARQLPIDGTGYRLMVDVRLVPLMEPQPAEKQADLPTGKRGSHSRGRTAAVPHEAAGRQAKQSGDRRRRKAQPHRQSDAKPKGESGVPDDRGSRKMHAS